jgi:hypothetical protein
MDNLFICGACDAEGVPDVVRSSGRHMEDYHLIHCPAPENAEDPFRLRNDRRFPLCHANPVG